MISAQVKDIANAVLYEGYVLYPYRPSSLKNRQRWTFGGVFPKTFSEQTGSDPCAMQTECLLLGGANTKVDVLVRFLHVVTRETGQLLEPAAELPTDREPLWRSVASLAVGARTWLPWEEALEREIATPPLLLGALLDAPVCIPFAFVHSHELDPVRGEDGLIAGVLARTALPVEGVVTISAIKRSADLHSITIRIENTTTLAAEECRHRDKAQLHAFASTHAILSVHDGKFLSLLDPPVAMAEAAASCKNEGCWPVMVGREGATDTVLASPIILYDYPQIASESPGDLFDGLEIDEILSLRTLGMTDAEKREAGAADPRVRALLDRTERLTPAQMSKLHGVLRMPRSPQSFPKPSLAALNTGAGELCVGDRVRLTPKPGAT